MRLTVPAVFLLILSCSALAGPSSLTPADLRCERMANPLGVEHPHLSWICEATDRSSRSLSQSAFQVHAASSAVELRRNTADLWDSGKVISDTTVAIPYDGKPLASRQRVFWKVRVWDRDDRPSAWSAPAEWTMGVLDPKDWRGRWIASDLELLQHQRELKAFPDPGRVNDYCGILWGLGPKIRDMAKDADEAPAVYMRREFDAPKRIRRALACVSGLGCFELHVNGRFAGPNLLDPAMCDYEKRVPYVVRDVTDTLKQGRNAIGVVLGNGWFNPVSPLFHGYYRSEFISPPQLRMDLEIEYEDGSRTVIATDGKWRFTTDGPVRYNCFAGGETYDARREMPDWSAPGFDDSAWRPALPALAPKGRMSAQMLYPVRALEEIPSVRIEKVGDDKWRFTLREAVGGVPRLTLRAQAGQVVTMSVLGGSGHTFGRFQTDIYTARGDGEEVYQPSLTYHGFGAVDVSGLGYEPRADDLVGVVTATDLPVVGKFACSDERLNRLQEVFRRTVYNYIIQIPNDPVREKSPWTQDVWNQFPAESWFYDVGPTYRKWQGDFLDGQFPDGYVAPVVPGRFEAPDINGPWWGGAIVYMPWLYYQAYGDASLLAESYAGMKKHFACLEQLCVDEKALAAWPRLEGPTGKDVLWWGLGDWLSAENPRARVVFTSTAALAWFARILSDTASILGRADDHAHFERRAKEVRETFNRTFLDTETGVYDVNGGQTAQALALALGLVPTDVKPKVEERLAKAVEARNHVASGFVGTPILLTTLSEIGRPDLAWTIATKPDTPGWFGIVKQGVYHEDWGGGGVQMPSLGAPVHAWFMEGLAGIRPDAGFRHLVLRPDLVGGLTWVRAWHDGPNGRIASAWSLDGASFRWDVTIPPNTTATIHVPAKDADGVRESGGMKPVRFENGRAVFEAGSGRYVFESER